MIGFYNYTVILTYIGLASAITGIYIAMDGRHILFSVIALMIAGLCDMFDGKIARTRKRTEPEKRFGIQIDSLCDLICFGLLPGAIGYAIGMREVYHIAILILFTLAAVIRLAYFNVMEEERQSIGRIFPDLYAFLLLIIAIAFVTRFKLKKPKMKTMLIFVGVGGLEFLWLLFKYKIK